MELAGSGAGTWSPATISAKSPHNPRKREMGEVSSVVATHETGNSHRNQSCDFHLVIFFSNEETW